jgi:hypothetical protein
MRGSPVDASVTVPTSFPVTPANNMLQVLKITRKRFFFPMIRLLVRAKNSLIIETIQG